MKIEECIEKLKTLEGFESGNPASDIEIIEAEKKLGNTLPDELKFFIKKLGFASWFGNMVCGISDDPFYNIVKKTIDARNDQLPSDFSPFPENAVVISPYGGGGYYLIFCEEDKRAGEVILILDETFYEEEESWVSLSAFLKYMYIDEI